MRQDDDEKKEKEEIKIISFGPIESMLYGQCSMFFCKPKKEEQCEKKK
jgi:hypothetical protein